MGIFMLQRILFLCLLGGFSLPIMAQQSPADNATQSVQKKLVELERSLAILQVSSATTDDYQALETQIESLRNKLNKKPQVTDRINFLSNLVFLMCVALLLCLFQLRRQSRQLSALLNVRQDGKSP